MTQNPKKRRAAKKRRLVTKDIRTSADRATYKVTQARGIHHRRISTAQETL